MARKKQQPSDTGQEALFSLGELEPSRKHQLTQMTALKGRENFLLCNTEEELPRLVQALQGAVESGAMVGIDPEFYGAGSNVKTMRPETSMIGFSLAIGEYCWYIPMRHRTRQPQLPVERIKEALAPLMGQAKMVTHNGKGDSHVFWREGMTITLYADTMTAAHFLAHHLAPHQVENGKFGFFRKGLKKLSQVELGIEEAITFDMIIERSGQTMKDPDFSLVNIEEATTYACYDAWNTLKLAEKLLPLFDTPQFSSMAPLFWRVAMPFLNLLAQIERRGVPIDMEHFNTLIPKTQNRLIEVNAEIKKIIGYVAETDEQIRHLIYETWKMEIRSFTDSGKSAVDKKALSEVSMQCLIKDDTHDKTKNDDKMRVLKLLDEQSKLSKMLSTYDLRMYSLYEYKGYGWLHTTFNESMVATNRLSSQDPNLQNQPSRGAWAERIRGGIVALEGWIWGTFDLSQIEPRGAAMIAAILGDPKLKNDLQDPERGDPYKSLSSGLTQKAYEEITKALREIGKVAMLAIIYGSSAAALAENPSMLPLGRDNLPPKKEDIQDALDALFIKYPGLKRYQRNIIFWAIKNGYAESFWGFRRPAPDIKGKGHDWRSKRSGESRALRNFGIQGWAAEFLKAGMLFSDALIKKYGLEDRIQIVLTVHDEIDAMIREDSIDIACALFEQGMTTVWDAQGVPIKFDAELGPNWGAILGLEKWAEKGRVKPAQAEDTLLLIEAIRQEKSPFADFPLARDITTIFNMLDVSLKELEPYCWHAANLGVAIDDPRFPRLDRIHPAGYVVDVQKYVKEKDGKTSTTYRAKLVARDGHLVLNSWDVPIQEGFYSLEGKWSDKYNSFNVTGLTPFEPSTGMIAYLYAGTPYELEDGRIIHFDRLKEAIAA